MNIVNRIYNARVANVSADAKTGIVSVAISYDNEYFTGVALCHTEDRDYFSEKVGYRIALSRAKTAAFKRELRKARRKLKDREIYYREVIQDDSMANTYDPTGSFARRLEKDKDTIYSLSRAIKIESKNLDNYIKGQSKAIESIKRYREKANNS